MTGSIVVLAVASLLALQSPGSTAPKREAEPVAPLVVHVVDATSGGAAADVAVTCVAMKAVDAEAARRWCGAERWFDPIEFDEVSRELGTTRRTDEHGDVTFERPDGELRVFAADELRFGVMRVKPADPPAATLELKPEAHDDVYVVDEQGKGVAGVPVAVGWGSGCGGKAPIELDLPPEVAQHSANIPFHNGRIDDAWPAAFDGVVVSTAPDGRARFLHASSWVDAELESNEVAILAFPVPNREQIPLARKGAGRRHELVLPPTGKVVLTFPGVAHGVAQLRNESRAFWRYYEPARAAIVDGKATFPFVGVGAKAQFRATWEGLSSPVEGELDGPRHAGDIVEFTASGAAIPAFLVRLVDEERRAISGEQLEFSVRRVDANGRDDGENFGVTTGSDGRVRFTLVDDAPQGGVRYVEIHVPWYAKNSTVHVAGCRFDMTPRFEPGVHDLGDVVLHVPGSRKCLHSLPDSELERIYRDAGRGIPFSCDSVHDVDTCLTEMIERGGSRWTAFIAAEVEGTHPSPDVDEDEDEDESVDPHAPPPPKIAYRNPRLLTALRRAQHRPDPVVLEVVGAPIIETTFPDVPKLSYRFKNVDDGGEMLALGSFDRGTESSRIEVRGPNGSTIDVRRDDDVMHMVQGFVSQDPIPIGASLECGADLNESTFFPGVGDYRVRLYHHDRDAHEFNQAKDPLEGWICSKSEEFTIRVRPREITLTQGDRKRLRERFGAIDLESPTILTSDPWKPDAEYDAPVSKPEDDLFRAGWSAVPVLLEVIDDPASSIQRRAWALALLSDITGLNRGPRNDSETLAFGRHRSPWNWPGVKPPFSGSDGNEDRVTGPKLPDVARQAELIRGWNETRRNFLIHE